MSQVLQYSTVTLAQFIENYVVGHLTNIYRESEGFGGATVFDLYQEMKTRPYGNQITTGFFQKILSDLRKTGIIKMRSDGAVFLSEQMARKVGLPDVLSDVSDILSSDKRKRVENIKVQS